MKAYPWIHEDLTRGRAGGRRSRMTFALLPCSWIALLATLLLATACGSSPEDRQPVEELEPVRVTTTAATTGQDGVGRWLTGRVEAVESAMPGTRVMGRVEAVLVREGDTVRAGDVLARLESGDLEAGLEQARAGVAMAEAQLENASAQHERMVELHARGSATEKNLEDARAGYRSAQAALEQAKAQVRGAEVSRRYADVRSPIDGSVVAKHVEAGDMAIPGRPLFEIEDRTSLEVVADVPEDELGSVVVGQPATIDVLGRRFVSEVSRVVPAADPSSRTFEIRLPLSSEDDRQLGSGLFARVALHSAQDEGGDPSATADATPLVPVGAVVRRGQLDGLYVAEGDGRLRLRWVELGRVESDPVKGDRVEVLAGLEPGERVVLEPGPDLMDGRRWVESGDSPERPVIGGEEA